MWLLFVAVLLLEIILDFVSRQTSECVQVNPNAGWLLIFHHITSCFLLYGWLFSNPFILFIHIVIVIGTIIHWKNNENMCYLTVHVNKICDWPREKPFHDLLDMLGIKAKPWWNEYGHYIFILIGGIISLWKLTQKNYPHIK